ncbi:translocation/assembly module TamB domain-containing protein [Hoeflea sp. Naph1]|uniref:translocation/assembly module TamB domain-containing protein n=1 Tax=Hoeflea sp. Naph1 TaxID=3388653 RepID=UPI00398FBA88
MTAATTSKRRPGLFWRVARWFIILILVIVAFVILLVSTAPGGRLIALTLNRLGSGADQSVEIDRIDGLLSGSTSIGHVLVKDAAGEPWLLIKGIKIDWSPLALLSSGLAIDDLSIERVELARLPEPAEKQSESSSELVLPLALDIKRLSAPDILLGEPVAGRVARLEAKGSLQVDASVSTALADLVVKRIDGVGGELVVDADYRKGEDLLNVSAKLSEPPGGVLAHLLQLAPQDAISVSATSQGTLADWQLNVAGTINDEIVAEAHLQLIAGDAGEAVSLQAEGAFEQFLPPALSQIVAGRSALSLEGVIEPDRSGAVIDIFTFASARLSAEGRGRVALKGEVDLTASISPQPGAGMLSFGADGAHVSLSVPEAEMRVSGNAEEASIHLVVSTARIEGADFSADEVSAVVDFGQFSMATRSGEGSLNIDIDAVGSANEIVARAVAGGVNVSGAVSLDEDGSISSDKIMLKSGVTNVVLEDITVGTAGDLAARLSGAVRSAVLSDQAVGVLGEELKFVAEVVRDDVGSVSVRDFQLSSQFATASGGVALDSEGQIAGDVEAELSNLAGMNAAVSGGLKLSAMLSGQSTAPAFVAKLSGNELAVQGRDLSGLLLEASGVADTAAPQADIELSGTLDGQPIAGTARLAQSGGVVQIDPLRLQVADNLIFGTLVLDEAYRPKGTIELDLKDIGPLAALALQNISGNGDGTVKFDVRDSRSLADIALDFPTLSGEGYAVRDARIALSVDDLMGTPSPVGTLDVASVKAGETDVSGLRVEFSQAQGWTVFDGKAQAAGFPVALKGRVRPGEAGTELELESGRTAYQGLAITLSDPARVVIRDGVANIERLAISPGGGRVAVSGTAGEKLDIVADLSGLPLASANAVAPGAGLSGTLSGQVKIGGTGAAPVVSYDLNVSNLRAAAASSVADVPLAVTATGGLQGGRLSFNARAEGSGLLFTATGGLDTAGAKQLSANINGKVPFSLLSRQLAAQGLALSGTANADISISGTAAAPQIAGTISTSDARLVDGRSGLAIDKLSAEVGLTPGQASIRSLSGTLSSGGQISGSGTIGIEPGSGYPADLKLKVARGRYADGQMVATRFDADLALSGALIERPTLSGTVQLDETTITVPDSLPASISQLDVTHKNASAAVEAQSERLSADAGGGGSGGLGLDLTVRATRIFVRGRGMDVELGGSVRLSGSSNAPSASGGFELQRGRLNILGKRLDFDRGKIGFAGSTVPILDFAASNRAGSTTVTVLVTGPANRPEFSFTSSPELPEDEVLALLIFGRSLNDLSAIQIAQLAEAAGQLTGVVKGGGLVEKLRRATGVDDIDVRTDEDTGETSLGVGKYLNDRTYLGLESGTGAGSSKARIDLDIGRGIKLRGEAGADGETKGGIFFEREY